MDDLSLISEEKTSGSEYVPSSSSESDGKTKINSWWEIEKPSNEKVREWLQYQTDRNNKEIVTSTIHTTNTSIGQNKINILQNINVAEYINKDIKHMGVTKRPANCSSEDNENSIQSCEDKHCDDAPAENSKHKRKVHNRSEKSSSKYFSFHVQEDKKTQIKEDNIIKDKFPESKPSHRSGIVIYEAQNLNGRRVRDKVHSCYFCMKTFLNMSRHFEQVHSNEMEVAKILAMEKSSKQRKDAFATIIRAGDFNYNSEVLANKEGALILVRRPTEAESKFVGYEDYGPCTNYLGFMLKKHLWHHIKTCSKKSDKQLDFHCNKNVVAESEALLIQVYGGQLSEMFIKNVVSKLRSDEIGKCCRNDQLILKFGAMLYEKYDITQAELIRQSMRQIGK